MPTRCPVCGKGMLRKDKTKEVIYGVLLGEFPADLCSACGESFTTSETMRKVELAAKKKGVWGLGVKTKITRTGNSLAVRIPKKLADYLDLKEGEETFIHPEGKNIMIDTK